MRIEYDFLSDVINLFECSYIHYDYGGNAGGTEVSMMILDHYLYTGDVTALERYFPIINLTLTFFEQHHRNRISDGKIMIFPTQVTAL